MSITKQDDKIKSVQEEISQFEGKYLRALADYQNLLKQAEIDKQNWISYGNSELIKNLLPILESLEKAGTLLKDEGLGLIAKEFNQVLRKYGVSKIEAMGEKFDPKLMECSEVVEGKEKDVVCGVVRNGYLLYDRVLQPVSVKVCKGIDK